MNKTDIIKTTRNWLENIIIDLNLCPFAKRELVKNRIRFRVSDATDQQQLLVDIDYELHYLKENPNTETTLLIHPYVLTDFFDYNDFLNLTDQLLIDQNLEGIFQIASMHPDYQFAETDIDDAENYTNRSPYPLLHLIREESLGKAVDGYPDPENIPQRNIDLVNQMGSEKMKNLLAACFEK